MRNWTQKEGLRIVWAIAAKDIADAIRNKTTISIVLGIALLVLSGQALPLIMKLRDTPVAIYYSSGESEVFSEIARRETPTLRRAASEDAMDKTISEAGEVQLGLVLPANVDLIVNEGGPLKIEGRVVHWATLSEVDEATSFFEDQLSDRLGIPVRIHIAEHVVYPQPDPGGRPFLVSMLLVLAMITIGAFLVPYLMVEEKESHTMDALLISPASYPQMVIGKAIAGSFYCLTAAAVIFTLNFALFVQWWLAILAVLCGALFTVALGLLAGTIFENPTNMNLWVGFILMILFLPMFFEQSLGSSLPPAVTVALPWIPSVALAKAIRISFSNLTPFIPIFKNLGIVVGSTVVAYLAVVWQVQRMDR
jgi:ABC-type transport system involved in multi-copper enzyme maturation permease subunit